MFNIHAIYVCFMVATKTLFRVATCVNVERIWNWAFAPVPPPQDLLCKTDQRLLSLAAHCQNGTHRLRQCHVRSPESGATALRSEEKFPYIKRCQNCCQYSVQLEASTWKPSWSLPSSWLLPLPLLLTILTPGKFKVLRILKRKILKLFGFRVSCFADRCLACQNHFGAELATYDCEGQCGLCSLCNAATLAVVPGCRYCEDGIDACVATCKKGKGLCSACASKCGLQVKAPAVYNNPAPVYNQQA